MRHYLKQLWGWAVILGVVAFARPGQTQTPSNTELAYLYNSNIWVVDDLGRNPHQLTSGGKDCCLAWSPDGNTLYFVRDSDENGQIVSYNLLTQTETPILLPDHAVGNGLALSNDGSLLAFVYNVELIPFPGETLLINNQACLALLYLYSAQARNVTCFDQAFLSQLDFDPNGEFVATVISGYEYAEILTINLRAGWHQSIVCCTSPHYFQDGNSLLYVSHSMSDLPAESGIFQWDLWTGNHFLVVPLEQVNGLDISADNFRLLYSSANEIHVLNLTTGVNKLVTQGQYPVWRPVSTHRFTDLWPPAFSTPIHTPVAVPAGENGPDPAGTPPTVSKINLIIAATILLVAVTVFLWQLLFPPPPPNHIICSRCHFQNPSFASFCGQCGHKLPRPGTSFQRITIMVGAVIVSTISAFYLRTNLKPIPVVAYLPTPSPSPTATIPPTPTPPVSAVQQPQMVTQTHTPTITPRPTDTPTTTPSPTPQKAQLVFNSNRDGDFEIFIANLDGSNQRQLTDNQVTDEWPSSSPDGRQIAFVSERDGNPEIYLMNGDGSNQHRLTNHPARDTLPNWSPDGSQLVFLSDRDDNPQVYDIFIIDADEGNLRQITNTPLYESHPSWSVDNILAYASGEFAGNTWEIYTSNLDGSNRRQLTSNRESDWSPEWSPDGQQLLYLHAISASDEAGIYIMNKDGSNQRLFYTSPNYDWGERWSPDGRYVVFTVGVGEVNHLYWVDATGRNPTHILERGGYPSWIYLP